MLEGNFDTQAVIDAHIKRDYTSSDESGLTLLCPTAGCDSGKTLDMSKIDNANPFGGRLGRSQPVLVGDGLVASSPSLDVVKAIAGAAADASTSLADQPNYVAAAEALTANGTLIQSYFINPADIGAASEVLAATQLSEEQIKAIRERLQSDFVAVPAYNLIALGDVATETEEQALVALVYTTEDQAKAAAALFPQHLQDYTSLATNQPLRDLLDERGVTSIEARMIAGKDRSVMVLTLHAPLPSNKIPDDGSPPQASSTVYKLLVQMLMQRDLGWLATAF